MTEKKDFLSELAKEADAKKHGKRTSIDSVSSFVSKHKREDEALNEDDDDAYPQTADEQPEAQPVKQTQPAKKPAPAVEPVEEEEEDTEETVPDSNEELYGDSSSPEAFQDEERVKIEKKPIKIPKGAIIGGIIAAVLIVFLVWFFQFRASISMPNFVGSKLDDVSAWAKQYSIDSSAIQTLSPEYSMDYDDGIIMKQSVSEGTKIKKNTPINLTVSQGANPDDPVAFPDIKSMTQTELNDWISTNKLSKTKITTQYSTTVESGAVISYDLKNVDEASFTRGSSLSIVCSKGAAPAGQITVENYVGKTYAELQTWATTKKILLDKQTEFSATVAEGTIISQGIAAGQTMKEGDTLTVVVSKGKGVTVPNLVGYTDTQLKAWQAGAGSNMTVIQKNVYSSALVGTVLAQDITAGSQVESGTVITLTTSLYLPIMEKTSNEWLGKDFMELKNWVDEANGNGASIQAGEYGSDYQPACSNEYTTVGQIIKYACMYGTSDDISNGCTRPLTTNSRITYQVSTGACSVEKIVLTDKDLASLTSVKSWCDSNNVACEINAKTDLTDSKGNKASVYVSFEDENGVLQERWTSDPLTFQDLVKAGTKVKVFYNPQP
jgi:serine/threonine-protein kinase